MIEQLLWYMRGDSLVRENLLVTPATFLDRILAWEAMCAFGDDTPVVIDEVLKQLEQTGMKASSRYYWVIEDQKLNIINNLTSTSIMFKADMLQ